MEITKYKRILELCKSIEEAVNYMNDYNCSDLVLECSHALKTIITVIGENISSLKTMIIFEDIKNFSLELSNLANNKVLEFKKLLYLYDKLFKSCKENIEYKIRVLFVAELGGKWDSMDSVYRAISSRKDCVVDVVLEPVYRTVKLDDGTVRQNIIYDDYLTGLGIQHIPFTEYSIEKVRPDITIISQPYETVTLEMFWPKYISQYSKLVYVPYYSSTTICEEIFDDRHILFNSDVESCSWRIACQSETMAEHYKNYASRKGKNLIVSGIPKWDYPFKLNKENTPCPEKWKKKLAGRKVFLWNTHFSDEHQGFGIFTEGIRFIKYFIENKNVALIWRPHPMLDTIIKVYKTEIYDVYRQLIDTINKSDNIVIDEYPTYDYSFVWSDALLSDYSSLIDQYIMTDKPYAMLSNKSLEETYEIFNTKDNLFDFSKVYFINSIENAVDFIEKICAGNDITYENRKYIREKYFSLSDGNVGDRFSEIIIDEFKKEIFN